MAIYSPLNIVAEESTEAATQGVITTSTGLRSQIALTAATAGARNAANTAATAANSLDLSGFLLPAVVLGGGLLLWLVLGQGGAAPKTEAPPAP